MNLVRAYYDASNALQVVAEQCALLWVLADVNEAAFFRHKKEFKDNVLPSMVMMTGPQGRQKCLE
jgi:hypothetical protein